MPEDSSDDSLEWLSEGLPSSSSEADDHDPLVFSTSDFPVTLSSEPPSETLELYRTVSYVPLAVALLGLALLLQVFAVPSSLGLFVALLAIASVAVSIVGVRRSQALPEEDSEAGGEES